MNSGRKPGPGRRGLVGRVIERRRAESSARAEGGQPPADDRLAELEARVDHLESLIEGLQDALHRDHTRLERDVEQLQHDTTAEEITRKLAEHARDQGL